jgi:predicted amidohydrolase YtcJ
MRTLYRASLVRTLSYPGVGEWVLVDGRHVQRVGAGEPPQADRVVELPGATILPGFVDAHVHLTDTGAQHAAPDVAAARSLEAALDAVRRVAEAREGPTLVHGLDESNWSRRDQPTATHLDAISRAPLAVSRVDGHICFANTAALEASGALDEDGVERDMDGRPTGRLTRRANAIAQEWFASNLADADVEALQLAAAALAASHGITSVHEMSTADELELRDLQVLLGHRPRLPVDVVPYVAITDVSRVMDLGLTRIGGDLTIDGSIGARTAWLSEPYVDVAGTGAQYFADEDLERFFRDGHLAGLQVAVHAIGDAAIQQVVETWERVYHGLDSRARRHFRARRHRIEHCEMPRAGLLERAAALGMGLSVQPGFDASWGHPGGLYDQALGWERAFEMNPFRDMLDRGIELGAGSDSPVTVMDPMEGIIALETHHDPRARLVREMAIRICTVGGARLAHQEEKKGTLEPGKHADFAAYDADPLDADQLRGLRPILTVSLGRDVYAA